MFHFLFKKCSWYCALSVITLHYLPALLQGLKVWLDSTKLDSVIFWPVWSENVSLGLWTRKNNIEVQQKWLVKLIGCLRLMGHGTFLQSRTWRKRFIIWFCLTIQVLYKVVVNALNLYMRVLVFLKHLVKRKWLMCQ